MADIKKALRDLADMLEREEEGESSKALQDRIDALEAKIADASPKERRDALDELELDDDELALIREHRAGKGKPKEEPAVKEPKEEPKPRRTRPGRKSGMLYQYYIDDDGNKVGVDIPIVYSGADEPDEVEMDDEPEEADAA